MAGDGAEQMRAVFCAARHRPTLIETRGVGDHAVTRDAAIGRLEPGHAAEGGRLTDRTAGVGTQCRRGEAGGDRGGAAAGGAAGHRVLVPRVLDRAVEAVFVGGAHGELIHVGLAQTDHAGRLELLDHGGVIGRDEVIEHLRAAAGAHAAGTEDVLQRQRQPGQRALVAAGTRLVGGIGRSQRLVAGHGDEGVEFAIQALDAVEQAGRELAAGKVAGLEALGEFRERHLVHGESSCLEAGLAMEPWAPRGAGPEKDLACECVTRPPGAPDRGPRR